MDHTSSPLIGSYIQALVGSYIQVSDWIIHSGLLLDHLHIWRRERAIAYADSCVDQLVFLLIALVQIQEI